MFLNLQLCAGLILVVLVCQDWGFFLDFLLRFFWIIMFMFCSIRCICAASNDSHYFFIFHRMLTATEQNMYFDYATCSFAQKVIVTVIN